MFRRPKNKSTKKVTGKKLGLESLEERRLLATITVTDIADNTITNGQVTLREAVQAANTNQSVDVSEAGE